MKSANLLTNKPIKLIWQVGKRYFDDIENWLINNNFKNIHVMPFIKRMDLGILYFRFNYF